MGLSDPFPSLFNRLFQELCLNSEYCSGFAGWRTTLKSGGGGVPPLAKPSQGKVLLQYLTDIIVSLWYQPYLVFSIDPAILNPMFSFFRNIRRKLISNAVLHKYFLYAAGEVLLVVLGILIALQVDNWNESRREQDEVANYLANLREALLDDIGSLEGNIEFNELRLEGIFYILGQAGLRTERFTEIPWAEYPHRKNGRNLWSGEIPDTLNQDFTILAFSMLGRGFGGAALNKSVINELYATGSFSDIQDQELKKDIGAYYRYLGQRMEGYAIEEHEEWANEVTRFLRDQYGIFTLDVSGLEDPISLIRGQKDVEHQLRYLALEVNYHCIWASHACDLAREVILRIDAELADHS